MAQCQYDAAISSITITADRAVDFSFSNPYFAAGQIVVVRADNIDIVTYNDLAGKAVGVQIDTTGDIEAGKIEGVIIHRYDDIELAFQDLVNTQLDAVIADNPLALSIVGKNPGQLKTAGDIFTDENYGIAVCKTDTNLVKKINIALAELRADGFIDDLTQSWIVGNNP
jgi:polar amino acid transport system substrate-binding protein